VITLAELSGADLAAYRAAVVASPVAPASQAQALSALRSFLRWSRTMGAAMLSAEVVTEALRTPRASVLRPYPALSEPELGALLLAAENPRDRALLAVLLGAGLRVSEVVGLDVADLLEDADGGARLCVRLGKGRKDRQVPVQPEVVTAIRRYLAAAGRRLGDPGPLFRAYDRAATRLARGRLTARSVGALVTRLASPAGIDAKAVSPHALRHTYALRCLRLGGDVVAVSELRATVPHLPGVAA
jgi:site-specific recombinase XerD